MKKFKDFILEATIKAKEPVRTAVSSIPVYWDKPGQAATHIDQVLRQYGYAIDDFISFNDTMHDATHKFNLSTIPNPNSDEKDEISNSILIFSWHRMPSGKYEITTYLS